MGGGAMKRFNMLGTEEAFDKYLEMALLGSSHRIYAEIGIAEGATLIHVANKLQEQGETHPWQAFGIDVANGPYFNAETFLKAAPKHHVVMHYSGDLTAFRAEALNSIQIFLLTHKPAEFPDRSINFCLIDGDHQKEAVMADFLSIERGMARGGIVAFHDALYEDQWNYPGDEPKHDIHVMEALSDLRLTFNCRPGWTLLDTVDGDKSPGSLDDNGNGFAFFQKL